MGTEDLQPSTLALDRRHTVGIPQQMVRAVEKIEKLMDSLASEMWEVTKRVKESKQHEEDYAEMKSKWMAIMEPREDCHESES